MKSATTPDSSPLEHGPYLALVQKIGKKEAVLASAQGAEFALPSELLPATATPGRYLELAIVDLGTETQREYAVACRLLERLMN